MHVFRNSEYDQEITIITNCRQTHYTARKSHITITRHQKDKLNNAFRYLSPHQHDCKTRMDMGRPDSSVGSVFHSDKLDISSTHVRISLASLAKILISEKLSKCSCNGMHLNGLTVTFRIAVVSQCISRLNAENCTGFPPPLDSRRLRSRIT